MSRYRPLPNLSSGSWVFMEKEEKSEYCKEINDNTKDFLITLTMYLDQLTDFNLEAAKEFMNKWANEYDFGFLFLADFKNYTRGPAWMACFLSAYLEGKDTTDVEAYSVICTSDTKYGNELFNSFEYAPKEKL